ncbi:hypothetical protein [Cohnella sp. JJ-181]|uniref:hypothetical protein n=1 Tax=Cohnella rhizoplanae TaxID=2974897 RepID=UPI0022FF8587|nr:hypothetical protein [Cohnella sp. JJ-181]CAI6079373.1 hypothetical protein COHCIP112018_02758 [Cohnella sp. JJ-181]
MNYTFNVSYEGANLSKQQDVGTDANVVFRAANVAVRLAFAYAGYRSFAYGYLSSLTQRRDHSKGASHLRMRRVF